MQRKISPDGLSLACAQKSWPQVTDCDRLDRAFAALEQQGVIALHRAGCTQSDGLEEVEDAHILFDRFGWLVLLELVGADKDERKYLYIHIAHALKVTHDWTHVLLLSPDRHNPI